MSSKLISARAAWQLGVWALWNEELAILHVCLSSARWAAFVDLGRRKRRSVDGGGC